MISAVMSAAVCSQLCSECSKGHFPDGRRFQDGFRKESSGVVPDRKEHIPGHAAKGKSNSTQREAESDFTVLCFLNMGLKTVPHQYIKKKPNTITLNNTVKPTKNKIMLFKKKKKIKLPSVSSKLRKGNMQINCLSCAQGQRTSSTTPPFYHQSLSPEMKQQVFPSQICSDSGR